MTEYIEAPNRLSAPARESIFLAGGVTGCTNWQLEAYQRISRWGLRPGYRDTSDLVVLNPRRENFPMDDPMASRAQIEWEFQHLAFATEILFWFTAETLQPLALFELGRWSFSDKKIYVGADRNYPRRQDVEIQMELARPGMRIPFSIGSLVEQVLGK